MKVPKSILERRRSIRVEESLQFTFGHKGFDIEAYTVNVSAHGAMCRVEHDIPLMTQLEITFALPGVSSKKNIRVKGVVVRKEKDDLAGDYQIAIFFQNIKQEDQDALNRFIGRRLEK